LWERFRNNFFAKAGIRDKQVFILLKQEVAKYYFVASIAKTFIIFNQTKTTLIMTKSFTHFYGRAVLVLGMILISVTMYAQQRKVSGTIRDEGGQGVPGINILEKGTTNGSSTDSDGKYSLNVSGDNAILVVSFIGYKTQEVAVGGRTTIDVSMEPDVTSLQEVVITGYTAEKKADIIGSVAVVNPGELLSTPTSNIAAQLQGRAAGVTVSGNGQPGAPATIRIRGFSSFGNNDPLYVIDGVPTEDASRINPQDIESVQVLKDATSASIYGARAANGVIIVTTKKGKSGTTKISYDNYVGVSKIPDSAIPDMLNTAQYADYLKRSNIATDAHPVFGAFGSPTVPAFIVVNKTGVGNFKGGVAANDPRANASLYNINDYNAPYQIMQTSPGTNWFKSILQNGVIQSHQVTATGGTDKGSFNVGLNYFNQEGVFKYTDYKRYTVRANTMFNPSTWLRVGENMQISYDQTQGSGNAAEGGAWAMAYRMVPYIPVYDIKGGFGGNGVGNSGNGSNPLANLYRQRDDQNYNYKIFGNVFSEVDLMKGLTARTSFGIDYGNNFTRNYTYRTYERSENVGITQLLDQASYGLTWTWTNTLAYTKTIGDHNIKVLAGTEAIKRIGNGIGVATQNYDIEDPKIISLNTAHYTTPGVYNYNNIPSALSSVFGRVDYQFKDKYLFNATVRRDGSSKFGSANKYGTFPAFGVGWRLSEESFLQGSSIFSDLKLRAGWGQMGSQKNVVPENIYSTFITNASQTNYDITGSNSSLATGFAAAHAGSNKTKWETTETINIGADASLWGGKVDLSVNWFKNTTRDLLVRRQRNGLEPLVQQPEINIGTMYNKGIDLMLTTRGQVTSDIRYDASVTFTAYTNKVTKIDNESASSFDISLPRLSQAIRTQAGHPISSFYGYQIDGIYQNAAEIAAGPDQAGKVIGSWRYKDLDGDKKITDADKTFLGSPLPKFQSGINLGLNYKGFDVAAFFFWNYGNKIYNYTKYYTDMVVFVGGVSTRVLNDSWTPEHPGGTLPLLSTDPAKSGYTSLTTTTSNSYYVESGSYLRLRNLQIGYSIPKNILDRVKLQKLRIYVQGQNLFTITKYSGPDPDLSIQSGTNSNNKPDLYLGVDQSGFPNNRQFLAGINVTL
jgi:TonB-linked SusC/RagA family outer membrane protein